MNSRTNPPRAQRRSLPLSAGSQPPRVFLLLNGAIVNADAEGDDWTVTLLLAAKMAAVRQHDALLSERGDR